MEEYTEIVNENMYTENGKCYCQDTVFSDLTTFWLCEYQNLAEKLQKDDNKLKTYHFCKTANDIENIVGRSSLFADRIVIPDTTTLMGVGLIPENYQLSFETSMGFLSVVSELTDWINEGIVVIIPSRFTGAVNYSMDKTQIDLFSEYVDIEKPYSESVAKFPVQDMLFSSGSYNAIPSTNHPIVWEHINKIISDEEQELGKEVINLAAINSLNLNFLNDVPLDLVKEYRDKGYLAKLRQYMRNKFKSIETYPNDSDFQYKIQEISTEIKEEVSIHELEWDDIRKDLKTNLKMTVAGGVVAGGMSATITAGTPISTVLGAVAGCIPTAMAVTDIKNFLTEKRNLKRNGIHLLFDLKTSNSP